MQLIYSFQVVVESQEVRRASCSCSDYGSKCSHMAALLIWVEKNPDRVEVACRPEAKQEEILVGPIPQSQSRGKNSSPLQLLLLLFIVKAKS